MLGLSDETTPTDFLITTPIILQHIRKFKQRVLRSIRIVRYKKQTQLFENMLIDILSSHRLYHYPKKESYTSKLQLLLEWEHDIQLKYNGKNFMILGYKNLSFTESELLSLLEQYTSTTQSSTLH